MAKAPIVETRMQRLIRLVKSGHKVKLSSCYVDSFLSIYERGGEWFYESQVWAESPLEELDLNRVSVYLPVEF